MSNPTQSEPQRKNRKVRALLAGGLVAGIGIVVSLAAWNSSLTVHAPIDGAATERAGVIEIRPAGSTEWIVAPEDGTIPDAFNFRFDKDGTTASIEGHIRLTGTDQPTSVSTFVSVLPLSEGGVDLATQLKIRYMHNHLEFYPGAFLPKASDSNTSLIPRSFVLTPGTIERISVTLTSVDENGEPTSPVAIGNAGNGPHDNTSFGALRLHFAASGN